MGMSERCRATVLGAASRQLGVPPQQQVTCSRMTHHPDLIELSPRPNQHSKQRIPQAAALRIYN
eukprot:7459499-Pyramimonas_sp.AAC.1